MPAAAVAKNCRRNLFAAHWWGEGGGGLRILAFLLLALPSVPFPFLLLRETVAAAPATDFEQRPTRCPRAHADKTPKEAWGGQGGLGEI